MCQLFADFLFAKRKRSTESSLRGEGALPSHLEALCNVQPLVEPLLALELHRC